MNKKLYIIPLLAAASLSLSSCEESAGSIFDQSAAERLEQSKQDYADALCADGGIWEFQYFANHDEPGYVFVCEFTADGAVVFHTDHKWIGNTYKSEKSLWDVISDNGTVLSFNSYNTLFHVFSDPNNITGLDAPTNDEKKDIDETGYGHEGDYEFLLMDNDGQSIRLMGKKRSLIAWLHRLPADTDPQAYIKSISDIRNSFSKKFTTLCLTEKATGARYDMAAFATGVPSVVPYLSTNPYAQTVKGNGIFTTEGFRFMNPLIVTRMDDTTWEISEFAWNEEGFLESENAFITAQAPGVNLKNQSIKWVMDLESLSPAFKEIFDAASDDLYANFKKKLTKVTFLYKTNKFNILFDVQGGACYDTGSIDFNDIDTEATIILTEADKQSTRCEEAAPKFKELKNVICDEYFTTNISPMNPEKIVFTSKSNPEIFFTIVNPK